MTQRCIKCRKGRKTKQGLCAGCRDLNAENVQEVFEEEAKVAMTGLGLPEDEAERMLEDYQ